MFDTWRLSLRIRLPFGGIVTSRGSEYFPVTAYALTARVSLDADQNKVFNRCKPEVLDFPLPRNGIAHNSCKPLCLQRIHYNRQRSEGLELLVWVIALQSALQTEICLLLTEILTN